MNGQPYMTSRDYAALRARIKNGRVVCFLNYGKDCRDVALARWTPDTMFSRYRVGVRGYEYIGASTAKEFDRECRKADLEWVDPLEAPGSREGADSDWLVMDEIHLR